MARAKTAVSEGLSVEDALPLGTQLPAISSQQQNLPEYSQEELDEMSVAQRVRVALQGDAEDRVKIRVYRRVANQARMEFVAEYSLAEYEEGDLTMIRQHWGAGVYEIRAINETGVFMRKIESIAPFLNEKPPAVASEPAPSGLGAVLMQMVETQNQILQRLSERPDSTAEMTRTLGLITAMREAMGMNVQPVNNPAPAPSTSSVLGDIVSAIKQLRDVSDELNPHKPEPESLMGMVPQVLDLVKTGMSQRPAQALPLQPLQVPSSLNAPGQQHQPELTAENADMGITENLQQMALRGIFLKVLDMTQQPATPLAIAEFLIEKLPDEAIGMLDLPNWFDLLVAVAPANLRAQIVAAEQPIRAAHVELVRLLNEPEAP